MTSANQLYIVAGFTSLQEADQRALSLIAPETSEIGRPCRSRRTPSIVTAYWATTIVSSFCPNHQGLWIAMNILTYTNCLKSMADSNGARYKTEGVLSRGGTRRFSASETHLSWPEVIRQLYHGQLSAASIISMATTGWTPQTGLLSRNKPPVWRPWLSVIVSIWLGEEILNIR